MRVDQQIKVQLAHELCAIIDGWTLTEAATWMALHPSHISRLRHGKLEGFSIARLLRLIASHDYEVELTLRPLKRPVLPRFRPKATVTRYDRFDRPIPEKLTSGSGRGER